MGRDSDEAEFREFVASRRDRLRRVAFLLCGDAHRAEDAVQTALVKLYAVWHRMEPGFVDAYARRVVINSVRTHHARLWTKRERSTDRLPERRAADGNAGAADRMTMLDALARLPRRQRAVVVLRFWEDRSVAETAEILRCSTGSVKSHSFRGLRTLRRLLSETYANDEGRVRACPN